MLMCSSDTMRFFLLTVCSLSLCAYDAIQLDENIRAPHFDNKLRSLTTIRGQPTVLQCDAKGALPINVVWSINKERLESNVNSRYTIIHPTLSTGVASILTIDPTQRSDTALFACAATNVFGSDYTSFDVIVQEPPEAPYGVRVLDKSEKCVKFSWIEPWYGNSPITRYIVEYKENRFTWQEGTEYVFIPGGQTEAVICTLKPATEYQIRILAENKINSSESSHAISVTTLEGVPTEPPTILRANVIDEHSLEVCWSYPYRSDKDEKILGYYVGYKVTSLALPYVFETVDAVSELGQDNCLIISGLKAYTEYSIFIQSSNEFGVGPSSKVVNAFTAERIPQQLPINISCTALSPQEIRVSWNSPSLNPINGIIGSYNIIYGPSNSWYDNSNDNVKVAFENTTILYALEAYTNYSIEVVALTSGGDRVYSSPIQCLTQQDVPSAPADIKALVVNEGSALIIWRPPAEPKGTIEQFTIYIQEVDEVVPSNTTPTILNVRTNLESRIFHLSMEGLLSNRKHRIWVTASTAAGEGPPSKTVALIPNNSAPAKIAFFDDTFIVTHNENVTLPCVAVGIPQPEIKWEINGVLFITHEDNETIQQQSDGSLFLYYVSGADSGVYSCHAENSFGEDFVTYHLIVN